MARVRSVTGLGYRAVLCGAVNAAFVGAAPHAGILPVMAMHGTNSRVPVRAGPFRCDILIRHRPTQRLGAFMPLRDMPDARHVSIREPAFDTNTLLRNALASSSSSL